MRKIRLALLAGCLLLAAAGSRAQSGFTVFLNTAALGTSTLTTPFFIDFQLVDGDPSVSNTATITDFFFGGGGLSGGATLDGGAAGSLAGSVILTDSATVSEFYQAFTPGSALSFTVHLTTNVGTGPTPDQFSFALLDGNLADIPTADFGNALVVADIDSPAPTVREFASDPIPQAGGGTATLDPITAPAAVIPEPGTLALLLGGALPALVARRNARTRPKT